MSRITTSRASFSWARPAMRRACSSDVSRFRLLRWIQASLTVAPVEPKRRDLGRDSGRNEPVDRLAARDPLANVARRHVQRLDLEEGHTVWTLERGEHAVEALLRETRPGRDTEAGQVENAVRLLPGQEIGELVGSDQEDRFVEPVLAEHVHGARVRVALDLLV